jgi:tRNA pseudouridine55 synthase
VINGVLLLDKPAGLTSNAALLRARRALGSKKAGHAGTLDPFATGLLVIALGGATRWLRFALTSDKAYRARVCLGQTTDTGDCDGAIVQKRDVCVTNRDVEQVLAQFRGVIRQRPPAYSAIKHAGRRLYDYARAGIEVDVPEREVTIRTLEFGGRVQNLVDITVVASKGTYIRSLAEQIGAALGCGAHLAQLRRLASGAFQVRDAISLGELLDAPSAAAVMDERVLLQGLPQVCLDSVSALSFSNGAAVALEHADGEVAVSAPGGQLLGVGAVAGGRLAPHRVVPGALDLLEHS